MRNRFYTLYLLLTVPFIIAVAGLNLLHPVLHMFEGGQADMTLEYLTALAAQLGNQR